MPNIAIGTAFIASLFARLREIKVWMVARFIALDLAACRPRHLARSLSSRFSFSFLVLRRSRWQCVCVPPLHSRGLAAPRRVIKHEVKSNKRARRHKIRFNDNFFARARRLHWQIVKALSAPARVPHERRARRLAYRRDQAWK